MSPAKSSYDVVIIGGAMMGASTAWFLTNTPDFNGSVLVIERDPSYQFASTTLSNSCIRQQFSQPLNIQISQFGAEFITHLQDVMGGDTRVPNVQIQSNGYLYLADTETSAQVLRTTQNIQNKCGTPTELLDASEIKSRYPFYHLDDILLGSINQQNEGYWDSGTVFEWWRRKAKSGGVEFVTGEVTGLAVAHKKVTHVTLKTGENIACGDVVNATGPRGAYTAKMAGIDLPVEPRKRFSWVFSAANPLDQVLPLTIDPSGVHVRQDGPETYIVGCAPEDDLAVDFDDFDMDHNLWQDKIWPILAARIPQFDALKIITEWAGHYAYNTFDQNAITGRHPEISNFILLNGFSGHGLQQSPAMGRGVAELITYNEYRSLNLSPFHYERIALGTPFIEQAII